MSSEILSVLEYMEKEKGIGRADMIATIANALKTAAQKGVNSGQELKIDINPKGDRSLHPRPYRRPDGPAGRDAAFAPV
jgi:NusA N-terminal domain